MARFEAFYRRTVAPDLALMCYRYHSADQPPPPRLPPSPSRTRPYLPAPPAYTADNIPKLASISLHSMHRDFIGDKHLLLSLIQTIHLITGQHPDIVKAKTDVAPWKLRRGMPIGTKIKLTGPAMWNFHSKLVEIVLPRYKDFEPISARAGDGHTAVSIGLKPQVMSLFPEIEPIYESLPKLYGMDVTWTVSHHGLGNPGTRLLLSALSMPVKERKPRPPQAIQPKMTFFNDSTNVKEQAKANDAIVHQAIHDALQAEKEPKSPENEL